MTSPWYNLLFDAETGVAHISLRDAIGCYGIPSADLGRELAALKPKQIELLIDTTGGACISGLNTHAILSKYQTEVLITGNCWSAGIIVAMSGKKICCYPDAKILVHGPTTHIIAAPRELRAAANRLESLTAEIGKIIRQRTGQDARTVSRWLSRDTWFDATEAKRAGLVDRIVKKPTPRPGTALARIAAARDAMPESEAVFRDWLYAIGPITVTNRQKLFQDVHGWLMANVHERT